MGDERFKVLVVDDEPTIRELMQLVLAREGHTAKTASDGMQALEMLRAERFDFLLSDIKMPRMDGLELLRQARALDPDMTVIMMTGFGTVETAVDAIKSGAADFLTKPIRELEQIPVLFRRARRFQMLQNEVKTLRELNRLQDEFLSLVSHELRTPLTNIQGCLDAMRDLFGEEMSADARDMLAGAAEGADVLSRMVETLLLIADLQNDRIALDKQKMDLGLLFEDVSREILDAKGREVEVTLENADRPVMADIDCGLFTRAIGNIIENALKFNPDRHDLRISACLSRGAEAVRLRISNNGSPIPEEEQEKIFRRFKQGEHYLTRSCDGVGLGLPITRAIVKKHGGEIRVFSNEKEGVTFEIELPAAE